MSLTAATPASAYWAVPVFYKVPWAHSLSGSFAHGRNPPHRAKLGPTLPRTGQLPSLEPVFHSDQRQVTLSDPLRSLNNNEQLFFRDAVSLIPCLTWAFT